MQKLLFLLLLFTAATAIAQNKKPLTHDVYDGWKSAGERKISNNGKYVLYAVNPQEGDGNLYIHPLQDSVAKITIARGFGASFTKDGSFAIAKIKPLFHDTRQARIKKKET